MVIAWPVIGFYLMVAGWTVLLIAGFKTRRFGPFLVAGVALALYLNIGYFVQGQADAIAHFVAIYDVFDNLGLDRTEGADALAPCVDNLCSAWGDRYENHPSWGVAFYERFANGPALRTNLLYAHIFFNTVAFVLTHWQLFRPGTRGSVRSHQMIGRVSFGFLTAGTVAAVWMASEHSEVSEYGGRLAELGFYSMSAFVYGTAVVGIASARRGNVVSHRVWMLRHVGSMWGAFWLFRVMLIVTGPLLRNVESASLLLSIWLSAPGGIVIAELARRRYAGTATIDLSAGSSENVRSEPVEHVEMITAGDSHN